MASRPRMATIGHVEWTEFVRLASVPQTGEIAHGGETFSEPAGGGAVVAVQLARLGAESVFFTSLGRDEHGRRAVELLSQLGVRVHVAWRDSPTRRALTLVDDDGERTIITVGARLAPQRSDDLPWGELGVMDGVYFTCGDAEAMVSARAARLVVATPRAGPALEADVELDALILSENDSRERREAGRLSRPPRLLVYTDGARGGRYLRRDGGEGQWGAAALSGRREDSYGCGDSFAAGVTFGLATGMEADKALALGARCGAVCLTGRGPYGRQLTLEQLESSLEGDRHAQSRGRRGPQRRGG